MLKQLSQFAIFISILCFSVTISGNEPAKTYFSFPPGSNWVYVDQDGNEVVREAAADKIIPAQTFHAFSYEPAIEEWFDYIPHLQPNRFRVDADGITFYSSDEIAKFIKARLTREIETLILIEPPGGGVKLNYDVTSDVSDQMLFLPLPISLNEEWDTGKFNATLNIEVNDPSNADNERVAFGFSVIESGTVVATETVEVPAGTFEECLKLEFRTETEISIPTFADGNPPGETVTTLWLAPNVGIVKCHREMEDMLIKTIPDDEFPLTITENTLELKKFEIKPSDIGPNTNYFPVSPGSFWVYVDQDGNEFTRRAIDDVVIPEKRLKAFNYKPPIENWDNYDVYTNPKLYEVMDDGIGLHVGDDAAKAVKARLNKELDVIEEITARVQESLENDPNPQGVRAFDIKYEVDIKTEELFQFLPNTLTLNEEWDVAKFDAKINLNFVNKNPQNRVNNHPSSREIWNIRVVETGKVSGRESIETPAGRFDDCFKVEFRSETTMSGSHSHQDEQIGQPGETITTLWIAPNVGIVKLNKRSENIILKAISKSSENEKDITEEDIARFNAIDVKTLELKSYEIKTVDTE